LTRESDGTWHAAASDLRSAKPLVGANVTLYSFQRRPLAGGATGPGGIALLKPEGDPCFATVQYGSQTSWLKVDEGSTLAVGHFDIGGEKADSGSRASSTASAAFGAPATRCTSPSSSTTGAASSRPSTR